jgi:lysyl-tRNA synthetase class II
VDKTATVEKKGGDKQRVELIDSEIRQVRLEKAIAMEEAGHNPYAYSFNPTHTAAELQCIYEGKLSGGEEDVNADVAVAGRIMTRRVFGKLAFFTLLDESGTIQLQLDKKRLGDSFKASDYVWPCMPTTSVLPLCTCLENAFSHNHHLFLFFRTSKLGLTLEILSE